MKKCIVPGCPLNSRCNGMCPRHRQRWNFVGKPDLAEWIAAGSPKPGEWRKIVEARSEAV